MYMLSSLQALPSVPAMLANPVHAGGGSPISWAACPPRVTQHIGPTPSMRTRMECATLTVPLDHRVPGKGTIDLALVRMQAASRALRRGTLVINPGGPGASPFDVLTPFETLWNSPGYEPLNTLTDRFDLLAMQPRGLSGHDITGDPGVLCQSQEKMSSYADVTDDQSDENFAKVERAAQQVAQACKAQPRAAYINTEQTAYDLESVRIAMGEEKFNLLMISYGTKLGAWYAAKFPASVGRVVLDSNMIWTQDQRASAMVKAPEVQRDFATLICQKAAADPLRYGMGNDAGAIERSFAALAPRVRTAVRPGLLEGPHVLMTAIYVDDVLARTPAMGKKALRKLIKAHVFSREPDVQKRAQDYAKNLITRLYAKPADDTLVDLDDAASVNMLVRCNDSPSVQGKPFWRLMARNYASKYPAGGASTAIIPCNFWGRPTANMPPLAENLANADHVLLVQAEFDASTPLGNVEKISAHVPGLKVLVAKGMRAHGVVAQQDPCMAANIVDFLTGTSFVREPGAHAISLCEPAAGARGRSGVEGALDGEGTSPEVAGARERIERVLRGPTWEPQWVDGGA